MSPHSHASSGNRYSQAQLKICRTGTTLGYGEAQAQAFLSSVAQQSLGRAQIPAAVQETTLLPAAQPITGRVWHLAGAALGTQGLTGGLCFGLLPFLRVGTSRLDNFLCHGSWRRKVIIFPYLHLKAVVTGRSIKPQDIVSPQGVFL